MTLPTQETVLSALRAVQWEGKDIVSSDMIVGMSFTQEGTGAKVSLVLEIEPKKNVDLEGLKADVEKTVESVDGITSANVILTAHQPAHKHDHAHAPVKGPQKMAFPGIKHIVAVASGKGGVGKSTTAVNLAVALSKKGLRVGLLDADVYGPSLPRMMGLEGEPYVNENEKMEPLERDGIKVMSMGFLIDESQPVIWRGPLVHGAITQLFRDVAWGDLDVMVVDLPPGTGDAQLTLAQTIPLSGAVIVSTPQDMALLDARKALAMFLKTDVRILGIVENMSFFECPHCHGRSEIFSHGGAKAEAEKLNVPFLGEITLTLAIRETSDGGQPLTLSEPEGAFSVYYKAIAESLWGLLKA